MKTKHNKWLLCILAALLACLALTGCMAGITEYSQSTPPGFLTGVWHGWIAPIALILRICGMDSVRMYETANAGIGYDIGFYMAVISGFGSLALFRRKKKDK